MDHTQPLQPSSTVDVPADSLRKQPYSRPSLKVYGSLHLRTQGTGGAKADAGNKTKLTSDPRLKQDIARLGAHPCGLSIYAFRYKLDRQVCDGDGLKIGFMADQVQRLFPQAVSLDENGYRVVDYSMIPAVDPACFMH